MRHSASRARSGVIGRTALLGVLLSVLLTPYADAIVGGTPVAPGRYPWMVAIVDAYTQDPAWAQFCGGVVVAPRRVLTAGHCVASRSGADVQVLIGQTRLSGGGGRRISVDAVIVHPGFVAGTQPTADAAILTLSEDAGVPALALASPADAPLWAPGTLARTIGWGALNPRRTREGNWFYADRLRELSTPVAGDDRCESAYGVGFSGFPYVPTRVVCAGAGDGRGGTCFGDSGGPLVVETPSGFLGVGILHGGEGCASRGYFDLFVRVDALRAFILGPAQPPAPALRRDVRARGRLVPGAVVRCTHGRAVSDDTSVMTYWRQIGDRSQRVIGRGRRYRLTARDARSGVVCTVVAIDGRRRSVVSSALSPSTRR